MGRPAGTDVPPQTRQAGEHAGDERAADEPLAGEPGVNDELAPGIASPSGVSAVPESVVRAALLRMAYRRQPLSMLLAVAVCSIFGGLIWRFFPQATMLAWVGLIGVVLALRHVVGLAYARAGRPDTRVWHLLFVAGATASGASWSLGPVLLMPPAGHTESILLVMTMLSVSAVAVSGLSAMPPAMASYVVATLAPTIVAMFLTGGDVERTGALVVLAAMVSLLVVGRSANASLRTLLVAELSLSHSIHETNAARRRAEAASTSKTRFLANMSHELRTPLNAVIGAAQLLRTGQHDAEQQQNMVDAIQRAGTSLLGLVENVLDLSRIEVGQIDLRATDFDLVDCVESALQTAALQARTKRIGLACVIDPDVATWRLGDSGRLRQVLLNLIGNAVKFTEAGEIVVRVGRGAGPDDVVVRVTDTGIGIGAASLPHVFEPFRQADDGANRRFGGSGLGLAIVRQLVEAMGGSVSAQSRLGHGSCFEVRLPLPRAALAHVEPPPLGLSVAYVESHDASAKALDALLARLGCAATRCRDAGALRAWCVAPARVPSRAWVLVSSDDPGLADLLEHVVDVIDPTRVIAMSRTDWHDPAIDRDPTPATRSLIKPLRRAALFGRLSEQTPPPETDAVPPQLLLSDSDFDALTHVLVVEDDPLNQAIVRGLLEHAGYRVTAVGDGRSALDAVREQDFDVVLMDWQMPGMDGVQVTRRMRAGAAGPKGQELAVIALTANAFAEDRAVCLDAGMNDFLTKPVLAEHLIAAIERWAPARQERDAAGLASRPAQTNSAPTKVARTNAAPTTTTPTASTARPAPSTPTRTTPTPVTSAPATTTLPPSTAARGASAPIARAAQTPGNAPSPPSPDHAADDTTDQPPVFDRGVLALLPMIAAGTQPEYADEVIALYLSSTRETLGAIRAAAADGDTKTLTRGVHTMKSSSASVGALALSQVCARDEARLRAGEPPAPGLVERLQEAFELLEAELARRPAHAANEHGAVS